MYVYGTYRELCLSDVYQNTVYRVVFYILYISFALRSGAGAKSIDFAFNY